MRGGGAQAHGVASGNRTFIDRAQTGLLWNPLSLVAICVDPGECPSQLVRLEEGMPLLIFNNHSLDREIEAPPLVEMSIAV